MPIPVVFGRSKKIVRTFLHLKRLSCPERAFSSNLQATDDVIGIDLGTTYSRVAVLDDKVPFVGRPIPSFVAITSEQEILVGQKAKFRAAVDPQNSYFRMKHLIGRQYNDPQTERVKSMVPYEIVCGPYGEACIEAKNQCLSPTHIYAHILTKMKEEAESYTMKVVSKAVIAVPVYFNNEEIKQIEAAGRMAELDVLGTINEPTASAISSCEGLKDGMFAILDFGGGTFDVSILNISNGNVEVKASGGDAFFGGDDFDHVLIEHLVEQIRKKYFIDLTADRMAMMRLKDAAEKAKIQLSSVAETSIYVDFISGTTLYPVHIDVLMTRAEFEALAYHLFEKIRIHCHNCLTGAGILANEINEVVLVGGMAKVPLLKKIVEDIFQKVPTVEADPDESVAAGAAILGGIKIEDGKDSLLQNVTPLSIGVETVGGLFTRVIDRNTSLPAKASFTFSPEANDQHSMLVRILQGEREMASDNRFIGELELKHLPLAALDECRVVVNFELDANGILSVLSELNGLFFQHVEVFTTLIGVSQEYVRAVLKDALLHGKWDVPRAMMCSLRTLAKMTISRGENVLLYMKGHDPAEFEFSEPLVERISEAEIALAKLKAAVDSGSADVINVTIVDAEFALKRLARWGTKEDRYLRALAWITSRRRSYGR